MVCPSCGGYETDYSEVRAETICTSCGAVLSQNSMVEGVSFTETSSGAKKATGRFLPVGAVGFGGGGSTVAREQALQRGYMHLQKLADGMRLPMYLADSAQRIYLLAVQRNFTLGRNPQWVAAACLYAACRRERQAQLLMDFSDLLRVPVRKLGAVFLKMLQVLNLNVPCVDPAIFLTRFARRLSSFEDQSQVESVVTAAVRLLQAMKRDWICTGRRPHGLCGAALLIAGRLHGIKLHADDVAAVIRMSGSTMDKRLNEFRKTHVAQLTSAEFEVVDVESLHSLEFPPCWGEAERRKARRDRYLALEGGPGERLPLPYYMRPLAIGPSCNAGVVNNTSSATNAATAAVTVAAPPSIDLSTNTQAGEAAALENRATSIGLVSILAGKVPIPGSFANDRFVKGGDISGEALSMMASEMVEAVSETLSTVATQQDVFSFSQQAETAQPSNDESLFRVLESVARNKERFLSDLAEQRESVVPSSGLVLSETAGDDGFAAELPSNDTQGGVDLMADLFGAAGAVLAAKGENLMTALSERVLSDSMTTAAPTGETDCQDDEETLSDVSVGEIEDMILDPEECAAKTLIWDEMTKGVMKAVYERWDKQKRSRTGDVSSQQTAARKRRSFEPASTAADSIRIALEATPRALKLLEKEPGDATSLFADLFTPDFNE